MVKPTANEIKEGTTSKVQNSVDKKKNVPGLGALDEDDEFEEFETEGGLARHHLADTVDWPEENNMIPGTSNNTSGTNAASVVLDMSGSARSGGDHLWEDNWDDDDIEDDFSVALRYVL